MIPVVAGGPAFLGETEERLTASGYRVVLALDDAQAVDLATMLGDRIGLAMVDVALPDASGFRAIQRIVQLRGCPPRAGCAASFAPPAIKLREFPHHRALHRRARSPDNTLICPPCRDPKPSS